MSEEEALSASEEEQSEDGESEYENSDEEVKHSRPGINLDHKIKHLFWL